MFTISQIPKTKFISLLCSIFTFLCPFLLSYPFLILYLVFSLPYILKIISFFSSVFVVAFVVLTAFLLILTNKTSIDCSKNESWNDFPFIDKEDGKFYPIEALEFYNTIFEAFIIDETNNNNVGDSEELPEEKILQAVESSILGISHNNEEEECRRSRDESLNEASLNDDHLEIPKFGVKEKRFEEFLKEVEEVEYMDCMEVDKEKPEPKMVKTESTKKSHSRRKSTKTNIDFTENGVGRFSRKEKEWKKTLACKLFQEKNSNDIEGYEGMDLLWETYEEKPSMGNSRNEMNYENELKERKIIRGYFEDEEDEEEIDVDVSCLHAFKFSGGKMNVGVGGRNIVRISKVIKGIRWLRSVTKHGKKMNNNHEQKCQFYK